MHRGTNIGYAVLDELNRPFPQAWSAPQLIISPVPFAIAAVPVAMYLILMGSIRLRRRPLVTSGWRDIATLGIAIIGLVAIGPVQLFFPTYAAARFSGWVWVILLVLYLLGLMLVVLSCRPRLIVYGLEHEAFTESLQAAALRVDTASHWQGQILTLPASGLQLVSQPTGTRAIHQAVSISGAGTIDSWVRLENELVQECARSATSPPSLHRRWASATLMFGGVLLIAVAILMIVADPAAAEVELREFFTR